MTFSLLFDFLRDHLPKSDVAERSRHEGRKSNGGIDLTHISAVKKGGGYKI